MKRGQIVEVANIKTPGSYYLCEIEELLEKRCTVHVIGTHHMGISVSKSQIRVPRKNNGKHTYLVGEKVHVFTMASNDIVACWWDATVSRELLCGEYYEVRWPEDALDADERRYSFAFVENMRVVL
ncbi:hypothetical protein KAT92_06845 [Candidatus Babeliales bacterium]|nr:hypothetical protein [Candidatus Babeliales bacterium]